MEVNESKLAETSSIPHFTEDFDKIFSSGVSSIENIKEILRDHPAIADEIEQEKRRQKDAQILTYLESAEAKGETYCALAKRFGVHPEYAHRLQQGSAACDGLGPGGRPHLSLAEEVLVAMLAKASLQVGHSLHISHFSEFAKRVFVHFHPNKEVPSFSKGWFHGFKRRLESLQIASHYTAPLEHKKASSCTRTGVNAGLQSLKSSLAKLGGGEDDYHECECIYFCDETDVTLNSASAGERNFNVGEVLPKNVSAAADRPHITSLTFANLNGDIACNFFFVGAPASVAPALRLPRAIMPNTYMLCNGSGSSENDRDGSLGSYHIAIKKFVDYVVSVHQGKKVALIVDSLATHVQDSVRKTLDENNILLIPLVPNLTSVLQLQDRPHIFGFLKGKLKSFVHELNVLLGSRNLTLEDYCYEVEKHIPLAHGLLHVIHSAIECGFEFKVDENRVRWARVTDATISATLDALVQIGRIVDDVTISAQPAAESDRHAFLQLRAHYREDPSKAISEGPRELRHFISFPPTAEHFEFYIASIRAMLGTKVSTSETFNHRVHVPKSAVQDLGHKEGTVLMTPQVYANVSAQKDGAKQKRQRVEPSASPFIFDAHELSKQFMH